MRTTIKPRTSELRNLADGTRKTLSTNTTDEAEARQKLAEVEARITVEKETNKPNFVSRSLSSTSIPLISEAYQRAYAEHWCNNRTDCHGLHIKVVIELMGDVPITQIDGSWLGSLKVVLKGHGCSMSTVNRYYATLKTMLRLAHYDWEVIPKMPRFKMASEKGNQR